jgi:hypothetical protein
MINLIELFCHVDDFCQRFMPIYEKTLLEQQVKYKKPRQCSLSYSEIITIILYFYQSKHRHFGSGAKCSDRIYLKSGKVRIDKTKNSSKMVDEFLRKS